MKTYPNILPSFLVSLLSVIIAFVCGSLILFLSGVDPCDAYIALLQGAFGDLDAFGRTLEKATPLIFNGLAIAFAFKAGLFNIGAQGQFLFGAISSAAVGFIITGVSGYILIPLVIIVGIAVGGLYGAIQGALKAFTGAHEVITGIMLNYVAINMTDYLTIGPLMDTSPGNIIPRTRLITESCRIPELFGLPSGFFIAIIASFIVWWMLTKTVFGFEINTVGNGIYPAKYSGIKINKILVYVMLLSGGLAGLGGLSLSTGWGK